MKKLIILISVLLLTVSSSFAVINNTPCVECHTMHNSQDGSSMKLDSTTSPSESLLRAATCSGCHAIPNRTNSPTEPIPQIDGQNYNIDTLAGGSFYFFTDSHENVHNVFDYGIPVDNKLAMNPPGWDNNLDGAPHNESTWSSQLTCAGTYGCHGAHDTINTFKSISGAHHETDDIDGTTVGKSYRFLNGIKGLEDSDWEYTKSETDHNVYKGKSRTDSNASTDKSTISFLCAKCHGKFHTMSDISTQANNGSSPWLRHPTDINLRTSGGEYTAYVYNSEAPVALSVIPANVSGADYSTDAIVTCISCHRAHGSPYPDILRWDYSEMIANASGSSAGTGCFRCHTTKDNQ